MNCPKCGCQNKYNALVCENCGASLLDLSQLDAGGDTAQAGDPFANIPEPKNPEEGKKHGKRAHREDGSSKKSKPTAPQTKEYAAEYDEDDTELEKLYYRTVARFKSYNERVNSSLAGKFEGNGEKAQQAKEKVKSKYTNVKDDIKSDQKKQKKLLICAIGIILVIILLIAAPSFIRSCSGCLKGGFVGTWGEVSCLEDGYDSTDIILELHSDGKVYSNGEEFGAYSYSKGVFALEYNGVVFSGEVDAGDKQISLYMQLSEDQVSEYAGMTLYKLTSRTGLDEAKLASLYPNA